MEYILHFFAWNFVIYWVHVLGHKVQFMSQFHWDHHKYILSQMEGDKNPTGWHWNNLFFYNDTWKSTVDLWLTEVIPSLLYSWITGQWWVICFYWFWAAFIQETIEHNPKWDVFGLSAGKWHLLHHTGRDVNYGLMIPLWDILFRTNKRI